MSCGLVVVGLWGTNGEVRAPPRFCRLTPVAGQSQRIVSLARCSLKSAGLEPECGVWETLSMAEKHFAPAAGDLVTSLYKRGIFKVLAMSHGGQTTAIQLFDISKLQLLGEPLEDVPCDTLLPFEEDANQAAGRIAK